MSNFDDFSSVPNPNLLLANDELPTPIAWIHVQQRGLSHRQSPVNDLAKHDLYRRSHDIHRRSHHPSMPRVPVDASREPSRSACDQADILSDTHGSSEKLLGARPHGLPSSSCNRTDRLPRGVDGYKISGGSFGLLG